MFIAYIEVLAFRSSALRLARWRNLHWKFLSSTDSSTTIKGLTPARPLLVFSFYLLLYSSLSLHCQLAQCGAASGAYLHHISAAGAVCVCHIVSRHAAITFSISRAQRANHAVFVLCRGEKTSCNNVFDKSSAEGKSRSVCTMPRRENVM